MAEKPESKTAELDLALHSMGFEIDIVSRERVTGRLKVEETCCQVLLLLFLCLCIFLCLRISPSYSS